MGDSEQKGSKTWWVIALAASCVGLAVAVGFAAWWFDMVSGSCGVVRFYEYLMAVLILGAWLLGTVLGLVFMLVSRHRAKGLRIAGGLLCLLCTLGLVMVVGLLVYDYLDSEMVFTSDQALMDDLEQGRMDQRIMAAHELGQRRVAEAAPQLIKALSDPGENINLRHNAAMGLGHIYAAPRQQGLDPGPAIEALALALLGQDEYLPLSAAKALAEIRDPRAVEPMASYVGDQSRDMYSRKDVLAHLASMGGPEVLAALEELRAHCQGELCETLDRYISGY